MFSCKKVINSVRLRKKVYTSCITPSRHSTYLSKISEEHASVTKGRLCISHLKINIWKRERKLQKERPCGESQRGRQEKPSDRADGDSRKTNPA